MLVQGPLVDAAPLKEPKPLSIFSHPLIYGRPSRNYASLQEIIAKFEHLSTLKVEIWRPPTDSSGSGGK